MLPGLAKDRKKVPNLPEKLVRALSNGKVIPFAGAGVSMAVQARCDGTHLPQSLYPSWRQLLENLAAELDSAQNAKEAHAVRALLDLIALAELVCDNWNLN